MSDKPGENVGSIKIPNGTDLFAAAKSEMGFNFLNLS